jgi:hypothetical protein
MERQHQRQVAVDDYARLELQMLIGKYEAELQYCAKVRERLAEYRSSLAALDEADLDPAFCPCVPNLANLVGHPASAFFGMLAKAFPKDSLTEAGLTLHTCLAGLPTPPTLGFPIAVDAYESGADQLGVCDYSLPHFGLPFFSDPVPEPCVPCLLLIHACLNEPVWPGLGRRR